MKTKQLAITFLVGLLGGFVGVLIFMGVFYASESKKLDQHMLIQDYYSKKQSGGQTSVSPVSFGGFGENSINSDFTYAADKGMPAVVHIKTQFNQPNYTLYDFKIRKIPRCRKRFYYY